MKLLLYIFNILLRSGKVASLPKYLQIEPNNTCNLDCKMCPRTTLKFEEKKNFEMEKFTCLINNINPFFVSLSGLGEPMMAPNLWEMIRYCRDRNIRVTITSNFILADRYLKEIIESGVNLIGISIDAATPETYFKIRKGNYFDKIIENINSLKEMKLKLHSKAPNLRFNFAIQKDNMDGIDKIIDLANNLGINTIYYQMLEATSIQDKDGCIEGIEKEDLQKRLINAYKKSKLLKIKTDLDFILNRFEEFWKKYLLIDANTKNVCLEPWTAPYIDVYGNVYPCCSLCASGFSVGNIFKDEFKNIWNGISMQSFRNQMKKGERKLKTCKNCVPRRLTDFITKLRYVSPQYFTNV
ncbi:MAG: radical SAM protein [bacterium]